jgi:molecular chaperone DnaJ
MDKSTCYRVLGIPENSSITTVKKAYRKLAFKYHPDRNSSPDAAKRFTRITKAYDHILSGSFTYRTSTSSRSSSTTSQSPNSRATKSDSREAKREERRQRAREEFKRREEAYRKSPRYKIDLANTVVLDQAWNFFVYILLLLSVFVLFLGFFQLTIVIWVICFRTITKFIKTKNFGLNGFKEFWIAAKYLAKHSDFLVKLLLAVNILFFIFISKNVMLPSIIVLPPTLVLPIVAYYLYRKKKWSKEKTQKWGLFPSLIIQMFFAISLISSTNYHSERYKVTEQWSPILSYYNKEKLMSPHLRMVFRSRKEEEISHVVYHVNKSVFGIKHVDNVHFIFK